jgi:tellurite resistance protein TehA-like permease
MVSTSAAGALRRVTDAIPPAAGAVVMGTGIVSVGFSLDHQRAISTVLLVLAGIIWLLLAGLLPARALLDAERFRSDIRHPTALTSIAGTAVLGTRLTVAGWSWAGIGLLVIALATWLILLWPVLAHWTTPTVGVSLLLTVSTESLAVLAATLAVRQHAAWLLYAALAPFLLGLAFYVFVIARFDLRQLLVGHGDHWITGGALAISTLAAGRITLGTHSLDALSGVAGALKTTSIVLWALTIAWLPVLVVTEAMRPRLGYHARRWSTVFPVGMYAACSFLVGAAAQAPGIADFARVWVWVGLAVWAVVFIGMLIRAPELLR